MSVRLKEGAAANALRLVQTVKGQGVRDHNIVRDKSAHEAESESQDKSDPSE